MRPSQRELAEATGLEAAYFSRPARALDEAGLITRTEASGDPRAVELALTPRGEQVITPAIAAVRALHAELLDPIGGPRSSEHERFRATLGALLRQPLERAEGEPST